MKQPFQDYESAALTVELQGHKNLQLLPPDLSQVVVVCRKVFCSKLFVKVQARFISPVRIDQLSTSFKQPCKKALSLKWLAHLVRDFTAGTSVPLFARASGA